MGPLNFRAMAESLLSPYLTRVADPYSGIKKGLNDLGGTEGARAYQGGANPSPIFHGSPTFSGGAYDLSRSSDAPRTDPGYLGRAMYFTPQEWIAKEYAKGPKGQQGYVTKAFTPEGKYLDVTYDENYIQNLETAAQRLGVKSKFNSPNWADEFANAARKAGYDGARGLNSDGSVAEIAVYDPSKVGFGK